jgi:hypothetical protein
MSSDLLDETDAFEEIYRSFDAKDSWLIITDIGNSQMLERMEDQFYKPGTDANADFNLLFRMDGIVIVLAKKVRMNYDQFIEIIRPIVNKRTLEEFQKAKETGVADLLVAPSSSTEGWLSTLACATGG